VADDGVDSTRRARLRRITGSSCDACLLGQSLVPPRTFSSEIADLGAFTESPAAEPHVVFLD
jgi:hypothetical protein